MQVKCPKCNWRPPAGAQWSCKECGLEWNVFDTAARCPRCHHQHSSTYCIDWQGGCGEESPHLDWYEDLDRALRELEIFRLRDQ